jgi:hypothetical protein
MFAPVIVVGDCRRSIRPQTNVFLAAMTGALLRWLVLAPHPVLFAKMHIDFRPSTWAIL